MFNNNALKIAVCTGFILVLIIKVSIPVTAVFIDHFSKQNKPTILLADQEKDDEKSFDSKDQIGKAEKEMHQVFAFYVDFAPVGTHTLLLYHQQDELFKQTHFPPILTPPPNFI